MLAKAEIGTRIFYYTNSTCILLAPILIILNTFHFSIVKNKLKGQALLKVCINSSSLYYHFLFASFGITKPNFKRIKRETTFSSLSVAHKNMVVFITITIMSYTYKIMQNVTCRTRRDVI